MVGVDTALDVEFIKFLKQFQSEVLRMQWKDVTTTRNPIKHRLDYIFEVYIHIHTLTSSDVNDLMRMLDAHKIHERIKNLIMAVWVCKLDTMNTRPADLIRQRIVDDHIFKRIR